MNNLSTNSKLSCLQSVILLSILGVSMLINGHFSIRSYTRTMCSHVHNYHQLVLPLRGSIDIKVGLFSGLVGLGDCVLIKAGQQHDFRAHEDASFIVVDTHTIPDNMHKAQAEKFSINPALLSFMQYIEVQLNDKTTTQTQTRIFELFYHLLSEHIFSNHCDKRIANVVDIISLDPSQPFDNNELAKHACLSTSQFKKLFKENIGVTPQRYLTSLRMTKAKALLTHTDTPINIIATRVGYQNASAFSRQFKAFFGYSPKTFLR